MHGRRFPSDPCPIPSIVARVVLKGPGFLPILKELSKGEGMKRLVVLIGLPGSGKTEFRRRHPEWAVVSKDAIRWETFHANYAPEYEDVIDRIFASTLVEVIASDAESVCVDDMNLERRTRRELIELAALSGREAIAYVLPCEPIEALFSRANDRLERLSASHPDLPLVDLPKARFDELARSYEAVDAREGFARVERLDELPDAEVSAVSGRTGRRKPIDRRQPLPLFVP